MRQLASQHVLVAPQVPFCLICGWGPEGPRRNKWFYAECLGPGQTTTVYVGSRPQAFRGRVAIKGVEIHSSHTLIEHRGLYMCAACGYAASTFVRELFAPCCRELPHTSSWRRSQLRRTLKGLLPSWLTAWPKVAPPPLPIPLGPGVESHMRSVKNLWCGALLIM